MNLLRSKSLLFVLFVCTAMAAQASSLLYSTMPTPLPYNLPSMAYEATSTSEFGNLIQFTGTQNTVTSATVLMSNWAMKSNWADVGDNSGYFVPMTLNIYAVGENNTLGDVLASSSTNAFINWRPEPTGCDDNTAYMAADGKCYHGLAVPVKFAFNYVDLPRDVIFGLAFNTRDYGADPTHVGGPYDSLNVALNSDAPYVGSNPVPGSAYLNSKWSGAYGDNGVGGLGEFRLDTGWDSSPAIEFTGTPEPTTYFMLGGGLLALSVIRRRRRA